VTATLSKTALADDDGVSTVEKLQRIGQEINHKNFERADIVQSMLTALISQQHVLMVGPGGTAKSQIVRDLAKRILDGKYFETALDETSTPDQVLGPPDIKAMVEDGKTRRVPTGMLPEAHIAFIDEVFNGNGPVLHSLMPILNERIFHNNGQPSSTNLLMALAGTNKLNADADMAALWDRWHIRHQVNFVKDRDNRDSLLRAAMLRAVSTYKEPEFTTVTVDELKTAHDEAMQLPIPDITMSTFLDLIEVLEKQGVIVSTRRQVEGLKAVVATAWLAGHTEVKVGDLSVLQHMFWTSQDQIGTVRAAILTACNPGEKKALEYLEELDTYIAEYKKASELDTIKRNSVGVDLFKKTGKLLEVANPLRDNAVKAGASTIRIDELIAQTTALKVKIGTEVFNLDEEAVLAIKDGRR
jgi:MoxR-like ATPase